MVWFDLLRIVDDDPEPAGQPDPAVVGGPKLGRDGTLDFPHVDGAQEFELSRMLKAAGVGGDQDIGGSPVSFGLESIDQFRRAGRKQFDLNAALGLKLIEHRLDQPLGAA